MLFIDKEIVIEDKKVKYKIKLKEEFSLIGLLLAKEFSNSKVFKVLIVYNYINKVS